MVVKKLSKENNLNLVAQNRSEKPPLFCPNCDSQNFKSKGKNRHGNQRYLCQECGRLFTANPRREFTLIGTAEGEYEKDIWDIRNLGIQPAASKSCYKLNFTNINQPWFLKAAKSYIRYSLNIYSYANTCNRLIAVKHFSLFLDAKNPGLFPSQINRSIVVDFLAYIKDLGIKRKTTADYLGWVKNFLELCVRENWADVPDKTLFYREDFPSEEKHLPRYIPQEVVEQLNKYLEELPEPLMRMVLVLQEAGMRISELCLLNLNCLLQDASGDWFLLYYQSKMRKEHTIPISRVLVAVIQEQQSFIKTFLPEYNYLFCSRKGGAKEYIPVPRPIKIDAFIDAINRLAETYDIKDALGNRWHFQTHQFRHTVGTSMINNGVPIHIVKRYLGHESFDMTMRYAHIHNQTLKQEIVKFHNRTVDVTGNVIEFDKSNPVNDAELQWFKKNVLAQALPNGTCALPTPTKECPHANACLTCTHFRTTIEFLDQHKEQLQQTEKLIEKANENGWIRQLEMNERVANNLRNIINSLEAENGN